MKMLTLKGGRRRLVTRLVLLVTAAAGAITATGAGAAQAATYPGNVTYSRYVATMNMYTIGCNQGENSDSLGQPHQMVLLNFGDPGWQTYGTWGAWDTAVGGFQTNAAIENAVKSYMQGFYNCTVFDSKSFLTVAPGVTNDGSGINSSAANALGTAWGNMIKDLNSWIVSNGMQYQLTTFGALDAEPSWGPYSYSQAWATGFMASNLNYYDFGSADGCPASGTGSCNNGWTQADEYQLAWGNSTAIGVPQIYLPTQAQQWAAISAWGNAHTGSGPILWAAALSQYQACKDHNDPCTGEDNTPQQSWQQLTTDSGTAPYYVTEMSYRAI